MSVLCTRLVSLKYFKAIIHLFEIIKDKNRIIIIKKHRNLLKLKKEITQQLFLTIKLVYIY